MARARKYDDPISIPFEFAVKDRIVDLAERYHVAQADVVRMAVDEGLDEVAALLKDGA